MKLKKWMVVLQGFCATYLLIMAGVVMAAPFEIIEDGYDSNGQNWRLCQDYLENLNSFPARPAMLCERKLNPKISEFSHIKWKKWTDKQILERRDLIRKFEIDIYSRPSHRRDSYERRSPEDVPGYEAGNLQWQTQFEQRLANKQITVSEGEAISMVDGKLYREIKYDYNKNFTCTPSNAATVTLGTAYFSIDMDELAQGYSPNIKYAMQDPVGQPNEPFLYNGQKVTDSWEEFPSFGDRYIDMEAYNASEPAGKYRKHYPKDGRDGVLKFELCKYQYHVGKNPRKGRAK